jgi:hypothetical protein
LRLQHIILAQLFLLLTTGLFAQEKKAAIGIGPEWNMNARENFAGGAALSFNYNLPHSLAIGAGITASTNFDGFTVLEPTALFRWYFLGGYSGFFAQADVGCFLYFEDGETAPMFDGGIRGGFRLPLGSSFYIEPYGRIGYPFAFGVGVLGGIRL